MATMGVSYDTMIPDTWYEFFKLLAAVVVTLAVSSTECCQGGGGRNQHGRKKIPIEDRRAQARPRSKKAACSRPSKPYLDLIYY